MEYLTLTIHIQDGDGAGSYPVQVASPNWGGQAGTLRMEADCLKADLELLARGELTGDALKQLGMKLSDSLLPRDVAVALAINYGDARCAGNGLRVRLLIDPPELREIPWELTYLHWWDRFLGCDITLPLTRHVTALAEARPTEAELPLRVLAIVSDGSQLNVDREKENLRTAFEAIGSAARLDLLEGKVTIDDISNRLLRRSYHVIHFVGHGKYMSGHGFIEIHDAVGGVEPLRDDRVGDLFRDHRSLRLAVLNACEGARAAESASRLAGVAQYLSAAGIPAVMAHQFPIQDRDAIDFNRWFYSSLTTGQQAGVVEAALAHARNQLVVQRRNGRAIGAPVLYVRESSGPLFTLKAPDIESLRRRLATHERSLRILERDARRIGFTSDARLEEIETKREQIVDLQEELRDAETLLTTIRDRQ